MDASRGIADLFAASEDLLAACRQMLVCCGGSQFWEGQTRDALRAMEIAVAKAAQDGPGYDYDVVNGRVIAQSDDEHGMPAGGGR